MNKPTFKSTRLRAAAMALTLSAALGQALLAPADAFAASEPAIKLMTLRGVDVQASDPEGDGTRYGRDQAPLPRDFVQQPPLIPHSVKGYNITQNFNKCMDCHSKERAEETGATKVAKSHYLDREDNKLKNISPRRYFCMQCHVPQFDAKPLVENTYKPAAKKGE